MIDEIKQLTITDIIFDKRNYTFKYVAYENPTIKKRAWRYYLKPVRNVPRFKLEEDGYDYAFEEYAFMLEECGSFGGVFYIDDRDANPIAIRIDANCINKVIAMVEAVYGEKAKNYLINLVQ